MKWWLCNLALLRITIYKIRRDAAVIYYLSTRSKTIRRRLTSVYFNDDIAVGSWYLVPRIIHHKWIFRRNKYDTRCRILFTNELTTWPWNTSTSIWFLVPLWLGKKKKTQLTLYKKYDTYVRDNQLGYFLFIAGLAIWKRQARMRSPIPLCRTKTANRTKK